MRERMLRRGLLVMALVLSATGAAAAPRNYALPEETATFRAGEGREAAQNNCLACHSADYVNTQPPRRGAAFWQAEVAKMINAYHAPISEEDAKVVADYLARAY